MVKIITDSTCDLSKDIIEENEIEIIPLIVNHNNITYHDGIDIDAAKLYKLVDETGELPKTSAINIMDYYNVFKKYVDLGYEVFYTGLSSKMSVTFNNSINAKKMLEEELGKECIYIVDSMNLSTGIGLNLMKACKYKNEGMNAKEIAEKIEHDRLNVLSQFVIERFDYLYKGGRCSSMAKVFGSLLKIKPIIAVRNGSMHVAKKPIGKTKRGIDEMINQIEADRDRLDKDIIFVTHSIAPESAEYLVPELKKRFPDIKIVETQAGSVISSHCGPGTIGILYMVKD